MFNSTAHIWHPLSCDVGLDGTLTSRIELVCDSFDMTVRMPSKPISHSNRYNMHIKLVRSDVFTGYNEHRSTCICIAIMLSNTYLGDASAIF